MELVFSIRPKSYFRLIRILTKSCFSLKTEKRLIPKFSQKLHENVGMEVANNKIDILITVGNETKNTARVAQENGVEHVYSYDNNQEAIEKLRKILGVDDVVLVKASNSMNFKEIVENIIK